ncbi:hypothetical protein [Clostridium vincentii]|uniref:Reticulocyte-binding protein n=1 Tax=Clostridium vincentii TaxID=52704 RepID=A0A2T0BGH9_9CLOT|nr:hypothetical protein [Clostridium vincentii]PRR83021.1 hypothetical protein CLVI_12700 [Clostridium vincentii]
MQLKHKTYSLVMLIILFISLIFNIITSIDNIKYKYKVGVKSYNNIEDIRSRNESNIELLNSTIEVGTISNKDAIKLYENYNIIADSYIDLWNEYSFYEKEEKRGFSFKKIETNETLLNDVNYRIQEYLKAILYLEMETKTNKLEINPEAMERFKQMKNLSIEIDTYYKEFYSNELNGAVDEDKKDKIIKRFYWVDILEGINEINEKYINVEFKV